MTDVSIETIEGHIALVGLHRPSNNFFDTVLLTALADAYEELAAGDYRALVLHSEGKHFCAGLDFAHNKDQDIAAFYRNALRLFSAPLPVVAAVRGGHRRGARVGPLGRLPGGHAQQSLQRQLRPVGLPSRVWADRHPAPRRRRAAGCASSVLGAPGRRNRGAPARAL
jgi:hypothetical protein